MAGSLTKLFNDLPAVTVIDIGAALNEEEFAYQALMDVDKIHVIGFEGDATAAAQAASYWGDRADIHPYMIGDGTRGTFRRNALALTSSLYPTNDELIAMYTQLPNLMTTAHETPVETVRLDDVAEIETADALFIDVQGSELDVIRHAGRIMRDVVLVHTEVEFIDMYEGQPLFADIDPVIRGYGMMFHRFHHIAGRPFNPVVINNDPIENVNNHLWADAVYHTDVRRFDELDGEKLLKLALIMNDIYESIDVALLALKAFDRITGAERSPAYMNFLTT